MAKEELGKLSSEQIQKLAKTISEAKELPSQQEEIIKKVLDGEIEIGNTRITSLERYFDIYSKNLDKVAEKYSDLDDAFLVLNNKLNENYKKLSSDITDLSKQLKKAAEDSNKEPSEKPSKKSSKKAAEVEDTPSKKQTKAKSTDSLLDKGTSEAIKQIAKALTERKGPTGIIGYNPSDTNAGTTSAGSSKAPTAKQPTTEQTAADIKGASAAATSTGQTAEPTGQEAQTQSAQTVVPETVKVESADVDTAARAELKARTEGVDNTTRKKLKTPTPTIFEEIKQLKEAQDAYEALEKAKASGDAAEIQRAEEKYSGLRVLHEGHLHSLETAQQAYFDSVDELEKSSRKKYEQLELAKNQSAEMQAARLTEFRLKELDKVQAAELEAQNAANQLATEIAFASSPESIEFKIKKEDAQNQLTESKKQAESLAKFTAERELYYKQKNGGVLTKDALKRIQEERDAYLKNQKKNEENLSKERERLSKIEYQKKLAENRKELQEGVSALTAKGATIEERKQALYELTHDENGNKNTAKALAAATTAISSLAKNLENTVDEIGKFKGNIDTRLQGSNNETFAGSYWDQLTKDMASVGAVTPFFQQKDFANNIKSLVDRGIAFDLKQRAFLMTIQDKIANTFDVADGTLLRLVRIQQEDSTAGRLGMESALNSFLNEMYENTEYLKDVASSVRGSLQEMEALMSGAEATEVEYQVQKWMGSLYSVGMSQEAVQSIAGALGQIAAGQVDALTSGSGAGNLLVMAANDAGLTISDILTGGLNADETNRLLQATVNYLADIAESSKDNKVVQQQLAGVFGVKASDLRAATNLATDNTTANVYNEYLTYDNMLRQLYKMAGTMGARTSIGEMMTNVWENGQYTLAGSMASSPVSYLLYKTATLLDDTTGGIDFSLPLVMGTGTAQTFNVADLMRVGAVGTGILGSLGQLVNGLASSFSGHMMLASMGIDSGSGLKVTPRGTGDGVGASDIPGASGGATSTSGSGYVGNANSSDIKKSTIQETEDSAKKQIIEAQEEAAATQVDFINANVLKIYELLDDVANGKRSLNVKVAGYGLTQINNSNALSSAQGGVAGLLSNNAATNPISNDALSNGFGGTTSGSGSGVSGSGTVNGVNIGTTIGLGGWTIT
jgi:hypothetical protein